MSYANVPDRLASLNQAELTAVQRGMITRIMSEYQTSTCLSERDCVFLRGQAERYRKFGIHLGVTDRQWTWFESIYRKMFPGGAG
jgi:hypothetical protein